MSIFYSGNMCEIATQIQKSVDGDILKIVTVDRYSSGYNEVVKQARKELDEDCRPVLRTEVENMESYDVVFIGYPNWWGTMPMSVAPF